MNPTPLPTRSTSLRTRWARSIAAGNALIDLAATRRVILRLLRQRATGATPHELKELTSRELDVLRLIAPGGTEDARELPLTEPRDGQPISASCCVSR